MRNNMSILAFACLIMISVNLVTAQTTPAFASTPTDTEITIESSLELSWTVTGSDLIYSVIMVYPGNETGVVVGSGNVIDNEITIIIDSVISGEYLFSCEVTDGSNTISDEVIVTVVKSTSEESDSGNSDSGFLPGFGWYQFILGASILGVLKSRKLKI